MNIQKRDFNKEAASWDEVPHRVKLVQDIAKAISNEVTLAPDADVLDFGCGTGLLSLQLRPLVRSVTGVDNSQGMLDVLKKKIDNQNLTNIRIQYRDVEKGDALEGCYHLVVSSMTLHHIKKIELLLEQFYRICAPCGHLCIADLDPDDGQFHENNEGIFHFGFDRTILRQAFMEAGFDDIRDRTAAEVIKSIPNGRKRVFTIFLMTGRKVLEKQAIAR